MPFDCTRSITKSALYIILSLAASLRKDTTSSMVKENKMFHLSQNRKLSCIFACNDPSSAVVSQSICIPLPKHAYVLSEKLEHKSHVLDKHDAFIPVVNG